MKIDFNPRGNGACPLCRFHNKCRIRKDLSQAINREGTAGMALEIVIYACPKFEEKF